MFYYLKNLAIMILVLLVSACQNAEAINDDTNTDTNTDSNTDTSTDSNTDTNTDSNTDTNTDSGIETGSDNYDIESHLIHPEAGIATNITLDLWCYAWAKCQHQDTPVLTQIIPSEGNIEVGSEDLWNYGYLSAEGYYTELLSSKEKDGTTIIDLDAVPEVSHGVAGTVIQTDWIMSPVLMKNHLIHVTGPDGIQFSITTDDQGCYGLKDMPIGNYTFVIDYNDESDSDYSIFQDLIFEIEISENIIYKDLIFKDPQSAD